MATLAQDLPTAASRYTAQQRREITKATMAVKRQWLRIGTDFDAGWKLIGPTVLSIMNEAQSRIVASSVEYIPTVLEETGQLRTQLAEPNAQALVGLTGAGFPTGEALSVATIRAKQSVASGSTTSMALNEAGKWLSYSAGTILSDTGRAAEGLGMHAWPSHGWVRVLSTPSCSRCVILAGKWFKRNDGFDRHPGCDCHHMPASEVISGDLTVDPGAYYESLDDAGKLKFAGSHGNLKAIESGADINQIVNAYRTTGGVYRASERLSRGAVEAQIRLYGRESKFSIEGITRRGQFGRQEIDRAGGGIVERTGRRQGYIKNQSITRARAARLMPESIYTVSKSPEDAVRLLRRYGWLNDTNFVVAPPGLRLNKFGSRAN